MTHRVLLVVDDEPIIRTFVHEALTREDLRVEVAASGAEALRITQDLIPDVILLDIHMPRMDGLQTLQRLRECPWLAGTPIIMFSVERHADTVTHAVALGADDYVAKPFDLPTLEAKVSHWLEARRQPANAPSSP